MTERRILADEAVKESAVLDSLSEFDPIVVSTIHAELDIPSSDIDIICCYSSKKEFIDHVRSDNQIGKLANIQIHSSSVVCTFNLCAFEFEIYGSKIPVKEQSGFIHYSVMKRLVEIGGADFQASVRVLKSTGLKTEPAIARHLGLIGDPYGEVKELSKLSDIELKYLLSG